MKDNKRALDLLKTAISALGYLKPCNVSIEDYDFVVTADNALMELRDIMKGDSNETN